MSNPTVVSLQDVSAYLSGGEDPQARWLAHMTPSGAGTVHDATMHFGTDRMQTGSVVPMPGSITKPGGGVVAIDPGKSVIPDTPDEMRINRAEKSDRLVSVAPVAPPRAFSAGSVLHRESMLIAPPSFGDVQTVFERATRKLDDKAIEIASAFHTKKPIRSSADLPVAVASLVTNTQPDVLATAYAPAAPDFSRESPFNALLRSDESAAAGRFVPPAEKDDHSWVHKPLPPHVFSEKEQRCLAIGIYFEARGEPAEGQAAVSQVILNRVKNPTFPDTICGVVYQNSHWRNRCQFSFTCDGIKDRVSSNYHWKLAKDIAMATTAGKIWLEDIGSSTHYHATYVNPRWAHSMKRLTRIGLHIFYRTYNGGWS
ncbi:MAG: cell wall hydrolase [Pseudomonadota bacterium]